MLLVNNLVQFFETINRRQKAVRHWSRVLHLRQGLPCWWDGLISIAISWCWWRTVANCTWRHCATAQSQFVFRQESFHLVVQVWKFGQQTGCCIRAQPFCGYKATAVAHASPPSMTVKEETTDGLTATTEQTPTTTQQKERNIELQHNHIPQTEHEEPNSLPRLADFGLGVSLPQETVWTVEACLQTLPCCMVWRPGGGFITLKTKTRWSATQERTEHIRWPR